MSNPDSRSKLAIADMPGTARNRPPASPIRRKIRSLSMAGMILLSTQAWSGWFVGSQEYSNPEAFCIAITGPNAFYWGANDSCVVGNTNLFYRVYLSYVGTGANGCTPPLIDSSGICIYPPDPDSAPGTPDGPPDSCDPAYE